MSEIYLDNSGNVILDVNGNPIFGYDYCPCVNGFWYRADIGASVLEGVGPDDPAENNDPVRRWVDQFLAKAQDDGNQTTNAERPIYLTATPEVQFDGDDAGSPDYLDAGSIASGPTTDNVLICAVLTRNATKANMIIDKRNGTSGGVLFGIFSDNDLYIYADDTSGHFALANAGTVGTGITTLAALIDRTNDRMKVYLNSTTAASDQDCSALVGSLGSPVSAFVGKQQPVAGTSWRALNGAISELTWLHGPNLTETHLQGIITRFKARWST